MAKIMLADDMPTSRLLLKNILVKQGNEVFDYDNGQSVLDEIESINPDVVLLDVEMPGISGLEACKELRKSEKFYNIPICMISARDAEDEIISGLNSGADDYILKPIRKTEVLSKVKMVIAKRKAGTGNKMAEKVLFAGRYEIDKLIGTGGFSSVYLALDENSKEKIALKVLDGEKLGEKYQSQFLRECYQLSLLKHNNIMRLIDSGTYADKYYMATEYIKGTSLWDIIEASTVSEKYAAFIGKEIVKALQEMDKFNVIHRDIKPENILITKEERIVLIDFGLAKDSKQHTLSNVDEMQGTPQFMSPEYIQDEELTTSCDIYSLGITLYNAVTGDYPFTGNSMNIVTAHVNNKPPKLHLEYPNISKGFSMIIDQMLIKKPKLRISLDELYDYFSQVESGN